MRKWLLSRATLLLAPWVTQASEQCDVLTQFEMTNVSTRVPSRTWPA